MRISVYSHGETIIDADPEYQEPAIREAIEDGCNDVASQIVDYTDTERSDISHDHYAVVTEDDGTLLWRGWVTGDRDGPPAIGDEAPATAERDRLREQLAIATVALMDIKDVCDTGTFGHATAHSALDEIGGVKPAPPGEAEALREQLDGLRDHIDSLARGLDMSASTTAPSKKSEIETGCASALRGLLRNDGESDEETRQRLERERAELSAARAHAASLAEDLDDAGTAIADYRNALAAMQAERDRLRTRADRVRGLAAEWADVRGSDNERMQLRATVARAVLSALGDEP